MVGKVLNGDAEAGKALHLQVRAYGAGSAYEAKLLERRALSASSPAAYHLRLDTTDSGMVWRAGDTVYVMAENDPQR